MKTILHQIYKRIFIHWVSTLKGLLVIAAVYMIYEKVITPEQGGYLIALLVGLNFMSSKDNDKMETKQEFQIPDPKPNPEE